MPLADPCRGANAGMGLMPSQAQLTKLATRIEELAHRMAPQEPARFEIRIVHADGNGRFAACCLPGGACEDASVAATLSGDQGESILWPFVNTTKECDAEHRQQL